MKTRLVVAGVALTLVACGKGGTVVESAPSRPQGPDEVVVQVVVGGGFVPVEAAVGTVPAVTVLGDGTVITPAPVTAIYPGPAITPLQAAVAPAATVDGLVRKARDLNLLRSGLEFGQPPVADAPDTTVTINADGTTYTHKANALGINDAGPGLSLAQAANRRALQQFVEEAQALPPGDRSWQAPGVAVYHLGAYAPDPELIQPAQPWPFAQVPPPPQPANSGPRPCLAVIGPDARTLLSVLGKANARTPWVVNGAQQSLAFRPIVPGQAGCPS